MRTRILPTLACLLALTAALPGFGPVIEHLPVAQGSDPLPVHYQTRTVTTVLYDAARDKDLPVRVVFPVDAGSAGPRPLIVFSHGLFGSGEMYDPLARHWAANGFVVAQPTHSDSIQLRRHNKKKNRRARQPHLFADWPNRPRDISFVLDSIDELEALDPALAGLIDRQRIGVGGHSYGAFTSQLIGGVDPAGPGAFDDPRADAVLLISPNGTGPLFTEDSLAAIRGPALTISGDNDKGKDGQPASWRREGFDHSPPGTHALLWIADAHHNFGGITGKNRTFGPMTGPPNREHVWLVQTATLAFWQHTVRDGSTDVDALHTKLARLLGGRDVQIEHN